MNDHGVLYDPNFVRQIARLAAGSPEEQFFEIGITSHPRNDPTGAKMQSLWASITGESFPDNVRVFPYAKHPLALSLLRWADIVIGRPESVIGVAVSFWHDKTVIPVPFAMVRDRGQTFFDQLSKKSVMPELLIQGADSSMTSSAGLAGHERRGAVAVTSDGATQEEGGKSTGNEKKFPLLASVLKAVDAAQHPPRGLLPAATQRFLAQIAAEERATGGFAGQDVEQDPSDSLLHDVAPAKIQSNSTSQTPNFLEDTVTADADATDSSLLSTELVHAGQTWRQAWTRKFLGCIDGFENYRVLLLIAKATVARRKSSSQKKFVDDFEALYSGLPVRASPTNGEKPCRAEWHALTLPTQLVREGEEDVVELSEASIRSQLRKYVGPEAADLIQFDG